MLRLDIHCVVTLICNSLAEHGDEWDTSFDGLSRHTVSVEYDQRARWGNRVRLSLDDASVWLPIWQRIRLRRAHAAALMRKLEIAMMGSCDDKPKRR